MSGETNFRSAMRDVSWLQGSEAILVGYMGSIAHGTYVPKSDPNSIDDKDVMAVVVPPLEYYFGLSDWGSRGTRELKRDEWDCVGYEVRKFVSLLCKGNPNVIGLLWLDEACYLLKSDAGRELIANRDLFSTKAAYHSFIGYAHGQLHRMTHYHFEGYMGEKRKALVDKFGYDTKNATHLIRLLRMGIEFLTEGRLFVRREDAPQLLEIKRGEWTLEKVKAEADDLFKLAQKAYIESKLPNMPDSDCVNNLLCDLLREHFA